MAAIEQRTRWALILCVVLCLLFATVSWTAVRTKSATMDEPGHAIVGWFMLWPQDFRLYAANPPLWQEWIALGQGRGAISFDANSAGYRSIHDGPLVAFWSRLDIGPLIDRGRMMSLPFGVLLAGLISVWSWQLGGPVAAVAATFLYCLDPNFLGHSPLIKNDVACAFFYVASAYALWRIGRGLTLPGAGALALLAAVTGMVKLSGLLVVPVVGAGLVWRALMGQDWLIGGRPVERRAGRLAVAGSVWVVAVGAAWGVAWMSYGFRFDAGPGGLQLPTRPIVQKIARIALQSQLGRAATAAELAAWRPPLTARAILLAERKRLIPQGLAAGLLNTELTDQGGEDAYLLGDLYTGGKWYYFPLAAIFKEPVATLLAGLAAIGVGLRTIPALLALPANRWAAVCLGLPAVVYGMAAVTSEMNIGYRHVFAVLPFIYMAVGLAAVELWRKRRGTTLLFVLAAGLAVETAAAFPDYIAFFNTAFVSNRFWLLSDSNLDWGQDLPLLAAWQRAHPDEILYLDYFGSDDPARYGLKTIGLAEAATPRLLPGETGVAAVSATLLQTGRLDFNHFGSKGLAALGIYPYEPPLAILGGTIYLFRVHSTAGR